MILYDFVDGYIVPVCGGDTIKELIETVLELANRTGKTYNIKFSEKVVTIRKDDAVEAAYGRWKGGRKK